MDVTQVRTFINYLVGTKLVKDDPDTGGGWAEDYSPEIKAFLIGYLGNSCPTDAHEALALSSDTGRALVAFLLELADTIADIIETKP